MGDFLFDNSCCKFYLYIAKQRKILFSVHMYIHTCMYIFKYDSQFDCDYFHVVSDTFY